MSGNYYGFTPGGTQFGNTYTPRPPPATAPAGFVQYTSPAQGYTYATPTGPNTYQAPFAANSGTTNRAPEAAVQSQPYSFTQDNTRPVYSTQSMSSGYPQNISSTATVLSANPTSYTSVAAAATTTSSVTTYSGYDAALYAAATNFVQSKGFGGGGGGGSGSGGGSWGNPKQRGGLGYSGGGGRGSFPKKHASAAPKQPQLLYCDVCKISCAGPQTYREHLEGKNHKKKEAQINSGVQPPPAKTKTSFRCDLCSVTCTGQDTYNAHVRGSKHQKTLKLHQQLNKPIPSTEPTIIPPSQAAKNVLQSSFDAKKVVVVPKVNFVGGQKLISTGLGDHVAAATAEPQDGNSKEFTDGNYLSPFEKDVQPVGEDYVELVKSDDGKLVSYFCKLCDCRFNDTSAKEMHLKGRRHRLQFKKKVNPDLEVEIKQNPKFRRQNDERMRREIMRVRQQDLWAMRAMYQSQMMSSPLMSTPVPIFGRPSSMTRTGPSVETLNDRYVMVKHSNIYPTDDECNTIQRLVVYTEKALKSVSDHFAENSKKIAESDDNEELNETSTEERLLKGVMRVGDLAKQLLLRGDYRVELVVLCSDVPTVGLLTKIVEVLPENLVSYSDEKFDIKCIESEASILVVNPNEPRIEVQIVFTSVAVREGIETSNKTDDSLVLDKQKCLDALASLRHAKWFQARCTNLPFCSVILRILKDLRQRVPSWTPLTSWAMELLVEKILCSISLVSSPAEALRHIFEAISSGILMDGGPGLLDPCEKEVKDALAPMSKQQREDITASAQHMLRQMAYGQMYKVLGMEKFDGFDNGPHGSQRKRPRESNEGVEVMGEESNGKKDKRENECD